MNRLLSRKFRFLTFMCIVLLAYVHGYNLKNPYLAPFSSVKESLTFTTFFEYLVANGLLRFRIPILFMISGYLYVLYDNQPYGTRIAKRFRTLLLPYLLWSALALLFTFLLQQLPYTARIVETAHIDQLGDNRPYTEIGWGGIIWRWLLNPTAYQLWFILVLFVYNLIYPFIRWILLRYAWIWLSITGFLWFTFFNLGFIEGQGLFFFSLGAWFKLHNKSIEKPPRWYSEGIAWILFIGLCVIKTFLAFELEGDTMPTFVILSIIYNLSVLCGIVAVWYSTDRLSALAMNNPLFRRATGYSFFLYGMHIPLLPYAMTAVMGIGAAFPLYRITAYLLLPAAVMALCLLCGWLLKRLWPDGYALIAGGRGL
ncbi:MAG: acyltransferase [Chitinophagaceae bacterium]|nr:acyltransferase [Chitinophagaceae bacterium]